MPFLCYNHPFEQKKCRKYEKNSHEAVDNLVKIYADLPIDMSKANFSNINLIDEWRRLVKEVKYEKKILYEYVILPAYAPVKKIKIENIVT